jgi:hypothetical protein
MDDLGIVVRFGAGARVFTLLRIVHAGCGAHPTCHATRTVGYFSRVNQWGADRRVYAVYGVDRLVSCGFESHRGHGVL